MRRLALAVGLALVMVACGVPVQNEPVAVRSAVVPPPLRPGPPSEPGSASTANPDSPKVLVNFVRADKLVGLSRDVPAGSVEDRLAELLAALVAGPTVEEQARGFSSALPQGLQLKLLSLNPPQVVLQLSGDTDGSSATDNVLAVGQIVLSVTSLGAVTEVRLAREGQPVEALLADGALTAKPLRAADYAVLRR